MHKDHLPALLSLILPAYNGPLGPPRPLAAPSPIATQFERDHQRWVRRWLEQSSEARQLGYGGSYDSA